MQSLFATHQTTWQSNASCFCYGCFYDWRKKLILMSVSHSVTHFIWLGFCVRFYFAVRRMGRGVVWCGVVRDGRVVCQQRNEIGPNGKCNWLFHLPSEKFIWAENSWSLPPTTKPFSFEICKQVASGIQQIWFMCSEERRRRRGRRREKKIIKIFINLWLFLFHIQPQ